MPCLSLQEALDTSDDEAMIEFARSAGGGLERQGEGILVPALFPEDDRIGLGTAEALRTLK